MGGPFNKLFFLVEIFGDEVVPDSVSDVLGRPADLSYRKGQERPRGSQYYNTGAWILKSQEIILTEESFGVEAFESWVSDLPDISRDWKSLVERFEVRVRLVGYTDQMNAEFRVSPRAMAGLLDRGLRLVVAERVNLFRTVF